MLTVGTVTRLGVNLLTNLGVSKVVNDVIQNNVNVVTTADAVRVAAGKFVLVMVAVDICTKNVNDKMDAIAEKLRNKEVKIEVKDTNGSV